jgi:predicted FMN-binding regulatory protein PaiB
MVRIYEQSMPLPWSVDASRTLVKRLLGQIVGFRIEIEKIEIPSQRGVCHREWGSEGTG